MYDDVPGAKLTKDPTDCTVEELKRWLECHGLKKGGRKGELFERVTLVLGKIKVDAKVDCRLYDIKKNLFIRLL